MGRDLECLRCGHKWKGRKETLPIQCPKCQRHHWNETIKEIPEPGEIQFNIRQMFGALQPILHHTTGIITHDGKQIVDVSYLEVTVEPPIQQKIVNESKKD